MNGVYFVLFNSSVKVRLGLKTNALKARKCYLFAFSNNAGLPLRLFVEILKLVGFDFAQPTDTDQLTDTALADLHLPIPERSRRTHRTKGLQASKGFSIFQGG